MTPTVAADISEHQPPVDDSYTREWLIFRACFGGDYIDRHAKVNLAWAVKARAAGKLKGFAVYVVYLPGENLGIMRTLNGLGVPRDCVVMIDAEKWDGQTYQINGDHSSEINQLATLLRKRQGGRADLVWGYGNRGPDLEVWPHKPAWLARIVASYGGREPALANLAGWQYTNGQPAYDATGRPHASAPFGRCDHNLLYKLPEGDAMPTAKEIAEAVWNYPISISGKDWPAKAVASDTRRESVNAYHTALALAAPAEIAKAVVAALPKNATGLTATDIEAAAEQAVRKVLADAAAQQ